VRGAGLLVAIALTLSSCGGSRTAASSSSSTTTSTTTVSSVSLARGFTLTSPAFKQNGAIPRQYTCDGAGGPIPLKWSGVPRTTRELVLIMRDPDAPGAPFVHWAVAGIRPDATSPAGVPGRNSTGRTGYAPPCPPPGKAHHYVITLNALSGPSNLKPGFTPDQLRTSAVGIATLVGTYARR
jgi:Raf kinase inhibitor-like YbhB/YbcL family protein